MTEQLSTLISNFEKLWPLAGAEDWDRPGLAIGDPKAVITKVLLSVDVTLQVLEQAKRVGAQLVLAHHPPLLKAESLLGEDTLKGELVSFAVANRIAIYAAHTNADIVKGGVSDVLASAFDLINSVPIIETSKDVGHGRIGKLPEPLSLRALAELVSRVLPKTNAPIRVAGDLDEVVSTVAVVGGAGDSFIQEAQRLKADVLITSDLRHHISLDAVSHPTAQLSLIDVSHYAAESLWLSSTAEKLEQLMPEVAFVVSDICTDPWSLTLGAKE